MLNNLLNLSLVNDLHDLFLFLLLFASQSILRVELARFGSGDQLGSSQVMQAGSQWRPQIRKKVDTILKFGPSNPQKRYSHPPANDTPPPNDTLL